MYTSNTSQLFSVTTWLTVANTRNLMRGHIISDNVELPPTVGSHSHTQWDITLSFGLKPQRNVLQFTLRI